VSVNTDEHPVAGSFDEARALEQLEELHEQILRARAARRQVEAEFDAFVQGFRRDPSGPSGSSRPFESLGVVPTLREPQGRPDPRVAIPEVASPDAVEPPAEVVAAPLPSVQRKRRLWVWIAIVFVAAAFAFALWGRQGTPAPPSAPATAARPAEPVATPPPAAAPAAPAPGVNMEMVTHRRVWVRVTIDGKRAFERELAADQRIPLHGEQTIVIRAGDAGAITLTRDGRDAGVLGRDGMIATREFTLQR
jgi:hypothetical protein